ncbi:MAG: hypothetical protein AB4290_22310 [Spirulina sp.]
MKITTIRYGYTRNIGNYQNDRLDIEVKIEGWEDPEQTYQFLRQKVRSMLGAELADECETLNQKRNDLQHEIARLHSNLERYKGKAEKILKGCQLVQTIDKVDIGGYNFTGQLEGFTTSITEALSSMSSEEKKDSGENYFEDEENYFEDEEEEEDYDPY